MSENGSPPLLHSAGELDPAIHQEVRGTHSVLRMMLDLIRPAHFAIAGKGRQVRTIPDWPFPGGVRYVIPYAGLGGIIPLAANTPVQLTAADGGNGIGTEIRNAGTGSVVLYLCDLGEFPGAAVAPLTAVPAIYLAPCPAAGPGGAESIWDGRISGFVYAGPITAVSVAGSSVSLAAL